MTIREQLPPQAPATEDATAALAAYAVAVDSATLPTEVIRQARLVLADTLGVLLASSTRDGVRTAVAATTLADSGGCTIVGHGRGASPETAALINGIGGHHIELDDFHAVSRGHIAAVVVPAALAAAEVADASTYGDLLAGLVAGYDVQVRVSNAMGPEAQYDRGFHPTSVCGTIGAAVCAGRILGLSIEQMRCCIGLAAAQCCGLLNFVEDNSHMQKSFQHGIAARNGVTAALLARQNFRAAPSALDGRFNVIEAFGGPAADPEQLLTDLGTRYEIMETTIKRHACCAMTHAAVDSLLSILDETGLEPETIERIDVRVAHKGLARVDDNALWTHNIQYVLALAAHTRRIELGHFTPEWTQRATIAALRSRVTATGDDILQEPFPERIGAVVTVTSDGLVHERTYDVPRGHPRNPLGDDELRDKFLVLAQALLDEPAAAALWELVLESPTSESLGPLLDELALTAPSV